MRGEPPARQVFLDFMSLYQWPRRTKLEEELFAKSLGKLQVRARGSRLAARGSGLRMEGEG